MNPDDERLLNNKKVFLEILNVQTIKFFIFCYNYNRGYYKGDIMRDNYIKLIDFIFGKYMNIKDFSNTYCSPKSLWASISL